MDNSGSDLRPRVLIFCDYYVPSLNGGGGMWAVRNIVERLSDKFRFFVVARNHHGRHQLDPIESVRSGEWNEIGSASVLYLPPNEITPFRLARVTKEISPSIVFLNSVFSKPVIAFLSARRIRIVPSVPTILAPCGELSSATLELKKTKKSAYLGFAKAIGLYRGLIFRASTESERAEIRAILGNSAEVAIAPDLTPRSILPEFDVNEKPEKKVGSARFVFVSRIARKKNLGFFLKVLHTVDRGQILLDIFGTAEDPEYLNECRALAQGLPGNLKVIQHGGVSNDQALEMMKAAHFFVLPTLNENFGYVCVEAMAAGCPLLLSDQTIWNGLEQNGIGWEIDLSDLGRWREVVERCVNMEHETYLEMSRRARSSALAWLGDDSVERATVDLFRSALDR